MNVRTLLSVVTLATAPLTGPAAHATSPAASGLEANGNSLYPPLSGDGRILAYASLASKLVADDTNGVSDIFVKNLLTGRLRRVHQEHGQRLDQPDQHARRHRVAGTSRVLRLVAQSAKTVEADQGSLTSEIRPRVVPGRGRCAGCAGRA